MDTSSFGNETVGSTSVTLSNISIVAPPSPPNYNDVRRAGRLSYLRIISAFLSSRNSSATLGRYLRQ